MTARAKNEHQRTSSRAAAIIAVVVVSVFAQGTSAESSRAGRSAVVQGPNAGYPWPRGHLYVLDVNGFVARFALAPDGLPATQPDGVLNLEGIEYPLGLAVDRRGHVFVADEEAGVVNEYAAGATGQQKPISILNLPGDAPDFLKMDAAERLYVHLGGGTQNQSIAIFAKGAQGNDQPISVVQPYYNPELASDYVITQSGALYILDLSHGAGILGYNDPIDNPSTPNTFMRPQGGWEFDFFYSLALDDAMGRLYIQFVSRSEDRWNKTNFAVRLLPGSAATQDNLIFNGQCGTPSYNGTGGAVIVKEYLMVSCLPNANVLVFRKDRFGRRQADEIVGQGSLRGPAQIAVGP